MDSPVAVGGGVSPNIRDAPSPSSNIGLHTYCLSRQPKGPEENPREFVGFWVPNYLSLTRIQLDRPMRALRCLALIVTVACGDSTGPEDPLPFMMPGDGVLRFGLGRNCPTLTATMNVGGHIHGPHTLSAGGGIDFAWPARTYLTSARTFPDPTRTWGAESITVTVSQRVTRTLSC